MSIPNLLLINFRNILFLNLKMHFFETLYMWTLKIRLEKFKKKLIVELGAK